MKKVALYSSSRPAGPSPGAVPPEPAAPPRSAAPPPSAPATAPAETPATDGKRAQRRERLAWLLGGALAGLALAALGWQARIPALTQQDIDAAVLHTLNTKALPSPAAKAYERIRPSVVRVRALTPADHPGGAHQLGEGSGVVIVEEGLILTNLHVAAGAPRLQVVFANGMEADAELVSAQPENDLAVLKARKVPDDLVPATLASTRDLKVGQRIVAVGFPFGVGPSLSAGVISGLEREFRSPKDDEVLRHLIQFDAAANPGSSGGPLVTDEGEVVGIVTAILSPGDHGGFVGIGFAVPIENAAAGAGMSPF